MNRDSARLMKLAGAGVAAALVVLLAPAGFAGDKAAKIDKENWKQAISSKSIAGYLQYLRKTTPGPKLHEEEAKQQLQQLVLADLGGVKEVSVTAQGTDAASKRLLDAGLLKLILEALQKQGYQVVEGDAPNQVLISVSQVRFLAGSPDSYWHFGAAETVSITFTQKGIGPIFRNELAQGPSNVDKEVHSFRSIRVKPLATDQSAMTYISPDTGQAWGGGIEFTMPSNDPNVIAADQKAFQDFNWAGLADSHADLAGFRETLAGTSLLRVDSDTQWVF
jgi:hypothetical protein